EIYPRTNLVYYGTQGQLEYDFMLAPGADPSAIHMAFAGAGPLAIDAQGDLVIPTAAGPILQPRPVLYQEVNGSRQAIAGGFVLSGPDQAGFDVGAYDPSQPLVIDPLLKYSTYLGGMGDDLGTGIAVDAQGNMIVTGYTNSPDFPTQNAYQSNLAGG